MNLLKVKEKQFFILQDYHNDINNTYLMVDKFHFASRYTENKFTKSDYRNLQVKVLRIK